jgi:GTP cyclohydrolase I
MDLVKRIEAADMLLETFPKEAMGDGVKEETPKRVAKMWDELLSGYDKDPEEILSKQFDVDAGGDVNGNGIVIVKDIPLFSQCEHHLVPFYGKVHIAYIPRNKVVGLSKFARLVECFGRRLQVQERLTKQIMDAIVEHLDPIGVMVIIEAEHMCMTMRGIQKPGTKTVTSRVSGVFFNDATARAEAMSLIERR